MENNINHISHTLSHAVSHRESTEIRVVCYGQLYNGVYVVCDHDRTAVYKSRARATRAYEALLDEYANAGWCIEPLN